MEKFISNSKLHGFFLISFPSENFIPLTSIQPVLFLDYTPFPKQSCFSRFLSHSLLSDAQDLLIFQLDRVSFRSLILSSVKVLCLHKVNIKRVNLSGFFSQPVKVFFESFNNWESYYFWNSVWVKGEE